MSQSVDILHRLRVVLADTHFPENIGGCARASANFGHCPIHLVRPRKWDKEKALPMATRQGAPLLDSITVANSLAEAVAPCTLVIGTTARTGGWRRQLLTPEQAAAMIVERLAEGEECALVFGAEDRGLENADLEHCGHLVTIPTAADASSLNLAQAVLILLRACFSALCGPARRGGKELSRRVTSEEMELFFATFKEALLEVDVLKPGNTDYFFLPMARFFHRADLRRHEMDMFMGLCRQIKSRCQGHE